MRRLFRLLTMSEMGTPHEGFRCTACGRETDGARFCEHCLDKD